ncbi:MAG: glycosyltransferase family 2 protein [Bacteroidaceae bacterium]|nr:glycosyltransferase family 2 protein [Bacteroidaceae bacterium]
MAVTVLSFCIPTKNRAACLDKCLDAIFSSKYYDSELIEVVVSDNASTDNTQEVVEKYVATQKGIIYNRNKENLGVGGELNFIKVLSLANGKMLKLLNDYTVLTDEAINTYLTFAQEHYATKPTAVFLNGKARKEQICHSMDEMVYAAEWNLTWIGTHVYWKETWDALSDKTMAIDSCFMQLDWCFRLFNERENVYVERGDFFHNIKLPSNKVDYNWFDVHLTKFFSVLRPYVAREKIKKSTFNHVRHILYKSMYHSFKDRCFKQLGATESDRQKVISIFYRNFKDCWWFYVHFPFYVLKLYLKKWLGYWWIERRLSKGH